ncbi:hypothetical protein T492DRAFT_910284 [Pavlovales sp. CCMP2436]|nr:hypothetical protein T492DRAFT_910284 [Pavlovales sp. CCMP2436]
MSTSLLIAFAREARPAIVPLTRAGASGRAARVLLVDGPAVLAHCAERAAPARGRAPRAHASARLLYRELLGFLRGLRDTGLELVVFAPGAPHPREAARRLAALLAREGEEEDEAASGHAVLLAACADLDVEYYACAHAPGSSAATGVSVSVPILSWLRMHAEERPVFAVLASSADYLVLGAERLATVSDVAAAPGGATLHVWSATASWSALRKRWAPYERGAVSLDTRVGVAVLLGGGYTRGGPRGPAVRAPALAAGALLAEGGGEPDANFFDKALQLPASQRGPKELGALAGALGAYQRAHTAASRAQEGEQPAWALGGAVALRAFARAPPLALAAAAPVPRALADALCTGLASAAGAGALDALAADANTTAPIAAASLLLAAKQLRAARSAAFARAQQSGPARRPVWELDGGAGALRSLVDASPAVVQALADAAAARAARDAARAAGSLKGS